MAAPSPKADISSSNKVEKAWSLTNTNDAKELYDEWADVYDKDLQEQRYASPQRAVEALIAKLKARSSTLAILDAGCGTGLVGDCLKASSIGSNMKLDGLDLSPGMLEVARTKGIYRQLDIADLSQKIALSDASYDVVICVGTLTRGHVGPAVLFEYVRLLKPDGLLVATIHEEVWQSAGFKATVQEAKTKGLVDVLETRPFGMLEERSEGGIMLVARKL